MNARTQRLAGGQSLRPSGVSMATGGLIATGAWLVHALARAR